MIKTLKKLFIRIKNYPKMRGYLQELDKPFDRGLSWEVGIPLEEGVTSQQTLNLLEALSHEKTDLNPPDERGAMCYPHRPLATVDIIFDNKKK